MVTGTAILLSTLVGAICVNDIMHENGMFQWAQKSILDLYCNVVCFFKKMTKKEGDNMLMNHSVNIPMLVAEVVFLIITMYFFRKYKEVRKRERIVELFSEIKEDLKRTHQCMDQMRQQNDNYTYLEAAQDLKSMKMEVPILHMAIIDTLGTRGHPESGDAGDTINITDSTLLSVTSLIDEDSVTTADKTSSDEKMNEVI